MNLQTTLSLFAEGRKPVPSNPKKKRVTAVVGRNPGAPMQIQTVIFSPKKEWTVEEAEAWARRNHFRTDQPEHSGGSYRFRQQPPGKFEVERTILLTDKGSKMEGKK